MVITQSSPTLSARNQRPVSDAPAPPTTPQGDDAAAERARITDKVLDGLISSPEFTKGALKQLGKGQAVTINVGGQDLISIRSEGPGFGTRFIDGAKIGVRAIADGASDFIEQDPSFAFRASAEAVKGRVYSGLDPKVSGLTEQAWIPMLRTAALAFDGRKLLKQFKDPSVAKFDKGLSIAHLGTDAVGLFGSLSSVVPALRAHSALLTAIGFAGDLAAYSIGITQYAQHLSQGTPNPVITGPTVDPGPAPTPTVQTNPKILSA